MKNLTPELIAKAKAAKSAEELFALAKENNVEMTEEQAKIYFEQLSANGAVSDDELDAVAGGGLLGISCPGDSEYENNPVDYRCPYCNSKIDYRGQVGKFICPECGKTIINGAINNNL